MITIREEIIEAGEGVVAVYVEDSERPRSTWNYRR